MIVSVVVVGSSSPYFWCFWICLIIFFILSLCLSLSLDISRTLHTHTLLTLLVGLSLLSLPDPKTQLNVYVMTV